MRFTTVVETSNAVASTSSRKEKVVLLAECIAALPEAETLAGGMSSDGRALILLPWSAAARATAQR